MDPTQLWSIADEHLGTGWASSSRGTLAGAVLTTPADPSRLRSSVEHDLRDLVIVMPDELVLLLVGTSVRTVGRAYVRGLRVDGEPPAGLLTATPMTFAHVDLTDGSAITMWVDTELVDPVPLVEAVRAWACEPLPPAGPSVPVPLTATILVTLFFGLFGLIPAVRAVQKEQAAGRPTSRYWWAFGLALVGSAALWGFVSALVIALVVRSLVATG